VNKSKHLLIWLIFRTKVKLNCGYIMGQMVNSFQNKQKHIHA